MLLGRSNELAAIDRALARARSSEAAALTLSGAPGLGKTALLEVAFHAALDFERVRIAAFESESQLPWAGLATLLVAWPALPPAAASVLRSAIEGAHLPRAAIGAALHAGIVSRCRERPVALFVDDAQWLDAASAETIAFACRRLTADRVALIAAQRADSADAFPFAHAIALGPLNDADCRALVRERWRLPPDVEQQCIGAADGNPLALLHMCGSLTPEQRSGLRPIEPSRAPPQAIAVTFARKLEQLPAATLRALAILATQSEPAANAAALTELDCGPSDLTPAESAGILTLGAEPRVAHPLWNAAILECAGPQLRRHAHAALAAHVRDPDRAALHRAAGAEGPSEAIAAEVEAYASRCAKRGLPALAARAWADGARLSEADSERARRALVAAQLFWDASLPEAAEASIDAALPALVEPLDRARALLLRHNIGAFTRDARSAALALSTEARRIAGQAPELELSLHWIAAVAALIAADATLGLEIAQSATAAARTRAQREAAEALRGYAAVHRGDGANRESIARLEGLAQLSPREIGTDPVNALHLAAWALLVRDRRSECARVLAWLLAESATRGSVSEHAWARGVLAELEFRRGRWLDALAHASPDPFGEMERDSRDALRHAVGAHVLAHLGDRAGCAARAGRVLVGAEATGAHSLAAFARAALGADALAHGDARTAIAALWPVWELRQRGGVGEAGVVWYQADLVEALAACGRRADAEELVRDLRANAAATGGRWAAAAAARGAALLGEFAASSAIAAARALDSPFELARTRLALVEQRVCSPADAVLREALACFERLGAKPWIQRARRELGDTGPALNALAHLLSAAELRVALLVARGATNGEVAGELVLSVRTVDAHVRGIFRKLGISRRAQLIARVAAESGAE